MASRLTLLLSVLALACLGAARLCGAQEFSVEQHFSVAIRACAPDGHCERFKRPLDADNEVACMMKAGMVGAVQWAREHPGWTLKEIRCAKDGEADL